jgi:general nucleoside transport system permease protein
MSRTRKLAAAGVALGLLAFVLTLPPFELRWVALPWALCALALGLGIAAVRDDRKAGAAAIALASLAALGAWGATRSGVDHLERVVAWGALTAAMLRYATPLVFGALGGLVSERSGVVNVGLEGMMLMGAFFGAYGADATGSWEGGLLIAIVAGCALAALHALFAVTLRADQIVSGTALNFLALGLTGYLYMDVYGQEGTPDGLSQVPDVHLPLDRLGFFGDALGQLNLLVWAALATVVVVWFAIFKTPAGLRLRSVGESPRAAETVGIHVIRTRWAAVLASGGLAAAGGAFLSIGFVHSFTPNMVAGRGFIALAALIAGRWRPFPTLAIALLFGFSSALAGRLPVFSPQAATLFQVLPYAVTLIAVAGVVGRSTPPAADGIAFKREGAR